MRGTSMSAPSKDDRRVAAFGFRSIPSTAGCAGADKFAAELLPRLAARGFNVTGYNRVYPGQVSGPAEFRQVQLRHFRTVRQRGFDTLFHSARVTYDILRNDTADIVHIQNGGNSVFGVVLRLFGKRVFLSQDGVDWKRDKWPWYGKFFLRLSTYLTAFGPHMVIFDNIFARGWFEERFASAKHRFAFIPFGSEVDGSEPETRVLTELGLDPKEYFLFVGRFIPDKGLHYLVEAFEGLETGKKLVLVGGAPNPSPYEQKLRATRDSRIVFPGFRYGADAHTLMRHAYAYVQPSDIEGLSPVILENMALETPVICSDIQENVFVVEDTAMTFRRGDVAHLREVLGYALSTPTRLTANAECAKRRAREKFSWDAVVDEHLKLFGSVRSDRS